MEIVKFAYNGSVYQAREISVEIEGKETTILLGEQALYDAIKTSLGEDKDADYIDDQIYGYVPDYLMTYPDNLVILFFYEFFD